MQLWHNAACARESAFKLVSNFEDLNNFEYSNLKHCPKLISNSNMLFSGIIYIVEHIYIIYIVGPYVLNRLHCQMISLSNINWGE